MALSPPDIVSQVLAHRPKQTVGGQSLTPASVLLLLYPKDGEYCVLLNKRSQLVEHHKGEISFPGGARDPVDRDSLDTALRETEEEMCIDRSDVTILGEMDEVGTIPYPYAFNPSVGEIAEVLEIPLTDLNEPLNHRVETRLDDGAPVTSRSYAYNEHLVFGATAKILQQFLELLEDGTAKEEH